METDDETVAFDYDSNDDNNDIDVSKMNHRLHNALLSFYDPLKFLNHNETLMLIDGYIRINIVPLFYLSDKTIPIDINSEIHQQCFIVLKHLSYWFTYCGHRRNKIPMMAAFCKKNPWKQGIIFCCSPTTAIEINECINGITEMDLKSMVLDSEDTDHDGVKKMISHYNNGTLNYIICNENSAICMLRKIQPKKFKIILNMELNKPVEFLERASIAKYLNNYHKVHIISLISDKECRLYEDVEDECNVLMDKLPSNLNDVLI